MAGKREGRVVVRRVIEGGHGAHHGGAWKVAYADFVTAMMAFFLLMWLLGTTSQAKLEGLAEYFTDPSSLSRLPPGGDPGILRGTSVMEPSFIEAPPASPFDTAPLAPRGEAAESELAEELVAAFAPVGEAVLDNMRVERAEEDAVPSVAQVEARLRQALAERSDLGGLREQLEVTRTPEGLRIELLDREGSAMFASGSNQLSPEARRLLELVAAAIASSGDRLSIRGHTDSRPFTSGSGSDNWLLSSDRANATRQALVALGLPSARIAEVIGKADTEPRLPERPDDPGNRRISILLLPAPAPAAAQARSDGNGTQR
ncbi:flagellar motor protein MotB [Geminicoccus flavidas]|uniref:flagellar motor protein MotB n=1 Tax=Geminicoccus flavidas TaxID=2506407 RepID=UPI0013587600|nr:flagellar motor protein MotB [Geminicoccus flavidas]